ncbi:hypothetical protein L1887_48764 [Cichorium endivia]|nr:hypothetical protein L1887_48764 [Cichorium endivia]
MRNEEGARPTPRSCSGRHTLAWRLAGRAVQVCSKFWVKNAVVAFRTCAAFLRSLAARGGMRSLGQNLKKLTRTRQCGFSRWLAPKRTRHVLTNPAQSDRQPKKSVSAKAGRPVVRQPSRI